jgi:hypothetical protein
MKKLSETWFAEGYIDFELKKYTLLAYLQEINRHFDENKLYPQLADVVFHYNNLVAFRDNKKFLQEHFPKKLSGLQMQKLELLYEQIIEDTELMKELEDIINFSATTIRQTLQTGVEIYEFVEDQINISPIGLMPLDNKEGYFFLASGNSGETRVYTYRLSFFEKHDEKYRSIKTSYVDIWQRSIANTYEHIKSDILRNHSSFPNPAVYSIEVNMNFPVEETLLPVAKRSLVRFISEQAA